MKRVYNEDRTDVTAILENLAEAIENGPFEEQTVQNLLDCVWDWHFLDVEEFGYKTMKKICEEFLENWIYEDNYGPHDDRGNSMFQAD